MTLKSPSRRRALTACLAIAASCLVPCAHAAPNWPELKRSIRHRFPEVHQLSVPTLAAWLADANRPPTLLIDVRPEVEYTDGHLPGALRAEDEKTARALLARRRPGQIAVLYCSVGWRSSELAEDLIDDGEKNLVNLEGSIFEWANIGYKVVSDTGSDGRVHPYDRDWGQFLRRDLWSRVP